MSKIDNIDVEALAKPLTYPTEAFLSKDYALAEKEKL